MFHVEQIEPGARFGLTLVMRKERGRESRSESERRNARRPRRRSRSRRIQASRRMSYRRLRAAPWQTPAGYGWSDGVLTRNVFATKPPPAKRSVQIARANARAMFHVKHPIRGSTSSRRTKTPKFPYFARKRAPTSNRPLKSPHDFPNPFRCDRRWRWPRR
jgi:hypothetical protein